MPIASDTVADGGSNGNNIWIAAGEGDLERVRYLVEVEGISPIAADQFTYTPLHAAASYGQREILRFLLTHSTTPENAIEITDSDGDTPLFAVEDVSIARLLVEEFGANAKHENNEGDTPAANAEENELEEVASYFRSVTGEEPMYQRGIDPIDDEEDAITDLGGPSSAAVDAAIEQRTESMMVQVQEILRRAEARGASSGEDLNEEEEAELRRVVGENILTQVREGWGVAVGNDVPLPASLTSNGVSQQNASTESTTDNENLTESSDADRVIPEEEEEEEEVRPGR